MTGFDTPPDVPESDRDAVLAAEFVLGLLARDDHQDAQARCDTDPRFAALVAQWEEHFSGLNEGFEAVDDVPNLLPAIEARLFGRKRRMGFVPWVWSGLAAAVVALFVVLFWPQNDLVEVRLAAEQTTFEAVYDGETLRVSFDGAPPTEGRVFELWAIGADGAPRSLGILAQTGLVSADEAVALGVTLAVSLEPEGGAPNGVPTGPILTAGVLQRDG